MKMNMVKWKLMLTTMPITLAVLLLKLGIMNVMHYEGLVKFSEIGIVVTGGVFLIGFMLAGTMADYKESERLPAELACAIETIEDTLFLAHRFKGGFDLQQVREQLREVTDAMVSWFKSGGPEDLVFQKINHITGIAVVLEKAAVGAIAARVTGEQHSLRKLFSRVVVIRKTNFLSTGYALLQVLTVVIIGLMMISKFENQVIAIIIVSFITQIFVYMLRLIQDVDQPFEYSPVGIAQAADVDLFPLLDYQQRSLGRS